MMNGLEQIAAHQFIL